MNLYITEPKTKISTENNKLIINRENEVNKIPIGQIENLSIHQSVQITSQTICKLSKEGINISWISCGDIICQTGIYNARTIEKIKKQFDVLNNKKLILKLASKNISCKINNQLTYINFKEKNKKYNTKKALSTDELLGIEGAAASFYFKNLSKNFPLEYQFKSREKHPPTDPVNAVLSYLYALLYKEFTIKINNYGLNPAIGFFHKVKNGHYSLSSDLMESFRVEMCDKIAVKLFNDGFDENSFSYEDSKVKISNQVRKMLITEFHRKLDEYYITSNGFANNFNGSMDEVIHSYIAAIEKQDAKLFKAFKS